MLSQIKWHSFSPDISFKAKCFCAACESVQQAEVVRLWRLPKRIRHLCYMIVLKSASVLGVSLSEHCFLWQERKALGYYGEEDTCTEKSRKSERGKKKKVNPLLLSLIYMMSQQPGRQTALLWPTKAHSTSD